VAVAPDITTVYVVGVEQDTVNSAFTVFIVMDVIFVTMLVDKLKLYISCSCVPLDLITFTFYVSGSEAGGNTGLVPTVGQGPSNKGGGVGKKKSNRVVSQSATSLLPDEKDADGSLRVPGYRGVWVTKDGRHFVRRLDGSVYKADGNAVFFDSIDDAAKRYDDMISHEVKKNQQTVELNYRADGSRYVYDDIALSSTSGLGGSASNAVPALSVINIKVNICSAKMSA
jgi:hypothetical protein